MDWTKEQSEAIELRGKTILVAAAAGSGKTAVLVERIRRLVCEEGAALRSLLVVTFTNAAAAEMKEKIRRSLESEAVKAEEAGDRIRREYIGRQLAELPSASICTFHAFALEVIKRFFYLIDAEPSTAIADAARGQLLMEDAMDALFEEEFARGADDFLAFMDAYSSDRNPRAVREMVSEAYRRIIAMPDPVGWMADAIATLEEATNDFSQSRVWKHLMAHIENVLSIAHEHTEKAAGILDDEGLASGADKLRKESETYTAALEILRDSADDAEAAIDRLSEFLHAEKGVTLAFKDEEKPIFKEIEAAVKDARGEAKEMITELKKSYLTESIEAQLDDMGRTIPYAKTLVRLVTRFTELYREAKDDAGVIDFADIEHFCLDILRKEEATTHYKKRFNHIFIDEYQDTNYLQEEIIGAIARENNLFMVGDVKQSIYRFRLAEPDIFKGKYKAYKSGGTDGASSTGTGGATGSGTGSESESESCTAVIDLNRNYRSRKNVIDSVNSVFRELMREEYDESAELHAGLSEETASPDTRFDILISEEDSEDELISEMEDAEKEALHIAGIIKEQIGQQWYDEKLGEERKLMPGDITILLRNVSNYAQIYSDVLKGCGIDAALDDRDGYFDTIEIMVFKNLLTVLDNPMKDVELISVLRSEIFGFTTEELAKIRILTPRGDYYSAFARYALSEDDAGGESGAGEEPGAVREPALCQKCADASAKLDKWRTLSKMYSLDEFLWKLLLESGYYILAGAMHGGIQRQANLRALCDMAISFAKDRQVSLYNFVQYIDSVIEKKVKTPEVRMPGEQENTVRIMTIHKSKGLEFPMVILAGIGRKLNYSKTEALGMDKELGFGMEFVNHKERWRIKTIVQKLIAEKNHSAEIEEEMRVLYVALTRARDRLHVVATVKEKNLEALEAKERTGRISYGSYLDMILNILPHKKISEAELARGTEKRAGAGAGTGTGTAAAYTGTLTAEEREEIIARLDYKYPHEEARRMKSKYSVSEVSLGGREKAATPKSRGRSEYSRPDFAGDAKELTAAEKGTAYHKIMEKLDFARAKEEGYIKACAEGLAAVGILSDAELAAVDLNKIAAFFDSDIGARAAEAARKGLLAKEKPFTLRIEENGEELLVQGIIDCYFIEGEGDARRTVLVDYKSNMFRSGASGEAEEERLRETYRPQLELYRLAIEKAGQGLVKESYLYLLSESRVLEM